MVGTTFLSDAFADINKALDVFVNQFSSGIANEIAPVVYSGLILSFIILGIMAIKGMLDRPFLEVATKMLKVSIIVSIALSSTAFQTYVSDIFLTLPDDIVGGIMSSSVPSANLQTGQGAAKAIEAMYDLGSYNAGLYFSKGGVGFMKVDILPYICGALVWLGTFLCVIVGALWLFIAKVVLALMLGIAPLFIVCLAWQPTQQYFWSWLGAVLNTVITSVLVIGVFAIFAAIFEARLNGLTIGADTANFADAATFTFLGVVCMGVLVTIPAFVSQLTGAAGGAVGMGMARVLKGAATGAATVAAGAAAGGRAVGGGVRAGFAAKDAKGAYSSARAGGASRLGAAQEARHTYNRSQADMKRGYPDYFRPKPGSKIQGTGSYSGGTNVQGVKINNAKANTGKSSGGNFKANFSGGGKSKYGKS